MLGASENATPQAGTWQLNTAYRDVHSYEHYNGTQLQYARQVNKNNVINNQRILDVSATYTFSSQCSASVGLPYVNASWSIPLPVAPTPGPRSEQNASGIGDISLTGRCWLSNAEAHPKGNVSLGVGMKAPTGRYDETDTYPVLNGTNPTSKVVDQSIQPGDGGWGGIFELQAYRRFGPTSIFVSGSYLVNPRDTNGADSIIAGLGLGANPAFKNRIVNSVPDNYVAGVGAAYAFGKSGFSGSLSWRIEGLPRYDWIGDSNGFRRPGYETYFEPRVFYQQGASTFSVGVPIGDVRNRQVDAYSGNPGDATFPNYVILANYSYRFTK